MKTKTLSFVKRLTFCAGAFIAGIFLCLWIYLSANYTTPILMYHCLNKERITDYAAVSPDVFYQQMKFIKDGGYKVLSLDDYCRLLKEAKSIEKKTVVITFDDGYQDNLKGVEFLKKFNYPATIFVVVDKIGKEGYLTQEDIEWLLKNTRVKIASHTLTHRYLPQATLEELKREIKFSKEKLEERFGGEIKAISYPVGGFDKRVLRQVEDAGYLCGCTTTRSFSKKLNRFALLRTKITNQDLGIRLWAKLSGFYNLFKRVKKPY